jgi:Uma2 family endonuclease
MPGATEPTTTTAALAPLMTAEDFARRPDPGVPEDLVRGQVKTMPPPDRRHGLVCGQAYFLLRLFVEARALGRVFANDSAVIVSRDPDTVRGADVAYYSFQRLAAGRLPAGYGPEVPELVIEARSAGDRWRDLHDKVNEYLNAGVLAVVVLDPDRRTAIVFPRDDAPRSLGPGDVLTLPEVFPDFAEPVARFYE